MVTTLTFKKDNLMKFIIDLVLTLSFLLGGNFAIQKIYFEVKKVALTRISKGLPPLTPFNEKLTGRKSRY